MKQPIFGLELLRGLAAFTVVFYHCMWGWSHTLELPTWGLYSVYVFFVISGAVIQYNYGDGQVSTPLFLLKRFARLAPLYLLAVLISAKMNAHMDLRQFLNAGLMFGLTSPGATSTVTGGWSLGIEFALYLLFLVLVAFIRPLWLALTTLAILFLTRLAFTEYLLSTHTLSEVWGVYCQPGAFVCFFFAGMLIAQYPPKLRMRWLLAITCAALLLAFPGESHEAVLTGMRGVVYPILCMALVACCFASPQSEMMKSISRFMGEISYGVYLLHPLIWAEFEERLPQLPVATRIALTVGGSAATAWITLRVFERPAKRWILRIAR